MTMTTQTKTIVEPLVLIRERYVKRSALFGLITWKEIIKEETISNDIHILTSQEPDRVFVNDVLYAPAKKPTPKN